MRFKSDAQRKAVFARIGGYHGSQFGPRKEISSGFHIGTKRAAEERLVAHNIGNRPGRISEYRIDKYEGDYSKPYLRDGKMLSEYNPDDNTLLFMINNLESEKNALLNEGYDYIPYVNAVEDKGSVSYMVLDPSKLKMVKFSDDIQETADDEFAEEILRKFGKTNNMFESGFVLPSGKMVDLSRGQGFREKKHDSIIEESVVDGESYYDALRKAMKEHKLMRVEVSQNSPSTGDGSVSFVEINYKPSEQQKEFIKNMVREVQRLGKESSDNNAELLIEYYVDGERKLYSSNNPKIYEVMKFLGEEVDSVEI